MKRNKQINIQHAFALAGTFNFLSCCARASLLPFLTLFLRQQGLSPAMTGIIMGTKHLIALLWSPASSLLSKHYDKRRGVIVGSLVCSAVVVVLLLFLPPADVHVNCTTSDLSGGPTGSPTGGGVMKSSAAPSTLPRTKIHTATVPLTHAHEAKPTPALTDETALYDLDKPPLSEDVTNKTAAEPAAVRNRRSDKKMEEENPSQFEFLGSLKVMDAQHQLFFLILIAVSLWEFTAAPLEWTADDGLYDYLDFADASDRYSSTSVWGVVGSAFGVGGAGLLVSQLPCLVAGGFPRSAAFFFLYVFIGFVTVPVAVYLPLYLNKKRDRGGGLLKALQLVHSSPHALLCVATTFLVGAAGSAVDNFLLWQMQDHGSSEMHMGVSLALALVSQAAYPLLGGRISKRLTPGKVLVVGAASLGVQCFYYSFLWGPWAVFPAQMLSCFSSGALWWAVKVQCEEVATPGSERSVRRVLSSLSLNLGIGLGSFAGGFVVQRFGLTWLFRGVALCVMLWCACLPLLQFKAPRQCRINYSRLLAANGSDASDSESESDWLEKAMEENRFKNNSGRRVH